VCTNEHIFDDYSKTKILSPFTFRFVYRHAIKIKQTYSSRGTVSVDRSNKTALLGTTPRRKAKSFTIGFAQKPILDIGPRSSTHTDAKHPVHARRATRRGKATSQCTCRAKADYSCLKRQLAQECC
jgi:hypothetical protein